MSTRTCPTHNTTRRVSLTHTLTHSLIQTVAHHTQQREVCTVTREYTHTCSQRTFKLVARARLGRICPHLPRRPSLRRPFDATLPSISFSDLFGAGGLEWYWLRGFRIRSLDGYFSVRENPCVPASLCPSCLVRLRNTSAVTGAPSTEMRGGAQASQRTAVPTA